MDPFHLIVQEGLLQIVWAEEGANLDPSAYGKQADHVKVEDAEMQIVHSFSLFLSLSLFCECVGWCWPPVPCDVG